MNPHHKMMGYNVFAHFQRSKRMNMNGIEAKLSSFGHNFIHMNYTTEMPLQYKTTEDDPAGALSRFARPLLTFAAVMTILIMITGICGNLLTIVALLRCPKVRNVAAAFIISLCIADFIFCMIVLPFNALRFIQGTWTHGDLLCRIIPFIQYGNIGVSLLCIAMITINRYIMITHHSAYARIYKKHWIAAMILFCWLLSYGMQLPTLFKVWGTFGFDKNLGTCSILKDSNGRSSKTALFIIAFVIPCLIIIACYTRIFWVVHESEVRMRRHASKQNSVPNNLRPIPPTIATTTPINNNPIKGSGLSNITGSSTVATTNPINGSANTITNTNTTTTTSTTITTTAIHNSSNTNNNNNNNNNRNHNRFSSQSITSVDAPSGSGIDIGSGGGGGGGSSSFVSGGGTTNQKATRVKDQRDAKAKRNEWRITKMVLAIFLSFVMCYLPITVIKVADKDVKYPGFHIFGYIMLYLSSCINPIIYVIMNKQYRQAYKTVLMCKPTRLLPFTNAGSSVGEKWKDIGYSYNHSRTMVSQVSIAEVDQSSRNSQILRDSQQSNRLPVILDSKELNAQS